MTGQYWPFFSYIRNFGATVDVEYATQLSQYVK